MTDEMLDARARNAAEAGVRERRVPSRATSRRSRSPDASVDVVISNCVINLSGDKPRVMREAARVLRPGGRFAVSDVIADPDMDEATQRRHGRVDGLHRGRAHRERVPRRAATPPASSDVEIRETHRVHEHAAAAIIRAAKPSEAAPAQARAR